MNGPIPSFAYCTYLSNDGFLPGALTLAQSLRNAGTQHPILALVTHEVSESSLSQLQSLEVRIVSVAVINGLSTENLARINRPDLHATLTKFHLWSLTQYSRLVYLDADTLALANLDHLFLLPESVDFAAASELGFPDCFNSGVMVLKPSKQVFAELQKLAEVEESLDGGDQGLLNVYFGDGSRGHPSKILFNATEDFSEKPAHNWYRLSYMYNMEMHRVYRMYIGAVLRYREEYKILHFIGKDKPWHFKDGKVDLGCDTNLSPHYPQFYDEMIGKWWETWREAKDRLHAV